MTNSQHFILGLGAAKSGTTTLASLLKEHPQIKISKIGKEVHFFDEKFDQGKDWYLGLFEHHNSNKFFNLDFTPSYLFDPKCRDRIFDTLGRNLKFVVILRNPFERAYSHYCHAVNHWWKPEYRPRGYPEEKLSFYDALLTEDKRLKSGKYHIRHQSYYNKGLYDRQLEYYFDKFPKSYFFVIIFEEFIKNHQSILGSLYDWLGISADFAKNQELLKLNSQTQGKIPGEAINFLQDKFDHSINNLEKILGKDLAFWRIDKNNDRLSLDLEEWQFRLQEIKTEREKIDIRWQEIRKQREKYQP